MSYTEYMSEVSTYQLMELGDAESSFLRLVMRGRNSAYKIYSYLKSTGRAIAYKNVYTRVKRLEKLNLILVERKFKRNAVLYRLTTHGLFYAFSHGIETTMSTSVLKKYQDDIILKTLLYPYFEKKTILHSTIRLTFAIQQYLQECCQMTIMVLKSIKRNRSITRQLEFFLRWHAKTLAFKLMTKSDKVYSGKVKLKIIDRIGPNNDPIFDVFSSMTQKLLSKDKKFREFLRVVKKEFEDGYKEII